MKKTKLIIFVTALAFLLFANISVTLFDGTGDEVRFELNSEQAVANPETDHLFEMPPGGSDGDSNTGWVCFQTYNNCWFLGCWTVRYCDAECPSVSCDDSGYRANCPG